MKTPITYYGGKQGLLKFILPMLPKHQIYVESFAGGAALFFAKPTSHLEIINDLNRELINFYRTIVSDFEELKKEIEKTLHSHFQHDFAWFVYNYPDCFTNVQRAWAVWCLSKLGFSGQFSHSFGFDKSERKHSKKISFAKQEFGLELKRKLEIVTIECDDAFSVIQRYDTPDTFHFIDPPYVGSNMGHYSNMFNDADLKRLLDLCSKLQGKFMLTMYPNEVIKSYSDANNWHIHAISRRITACKADFRRQQEEWIICNYENLNTQMLLF